MVGITEISAALSSLKAAKDILQGMDATRGAIAVMEIKIPLNSAILDAQEKLLVAKETEAANAGRVADLEQEIVSLKDWSAERERYQLANIGTGTFAYEMKLGVECGEPPHWLCARCFQDRKKSVLQRSHRSSDAYWAGLFCPGCDTVYQLPHDRLPVWAQ